jgi:hypothetical protein
MHGKESIFLEVPSGIVTVAQNVDHTAPLIPHKKIHLLKMFKLLHVYRDIPSEMGKAEVLPNHPSSRFHFSPS